MSDAGERLIEAAKEANAKVFIFDNHRFQKAMQVLRTAGYPDVADECYAHRSFSMATRKILDE